MSDPIVLGSVHLQMHWPTLDPFLFCAHHRDDYPSGDDKLGPTASLAGRNLGSDFGAKDGWSMYHGQHVPGFPQHPHRGFETITIARSGYINHSDSLGARARFGHGDCQWMTAGKGVVHAEMFPLLERDAGNPTELFQIWLNLPRADKMVDPYFTMLWAETIPRIEVKDGAGKITELRVYAGSLEGKAGPATPPNSWAAQERSAIGIFTIKQQPGATYTLPPAATGAGRVIYAFAGASMRIAGQKVAAGTGVQVRPDAEVTLQNGTAEAEYVVLQGRPIGEPVARHGPFVMNSQSEIHQAYSDYRKTRFGGWPYKRNDPVHERDAGRFAVHADGRQEKPGAS